jgi:hypothetical protein
MKNEIYVKPSVYQKTIAYDINMQGEVSKYFYLNGFRPKSGNNYNWFGSNSKQKDHYSFDCTKVPESIAVIPFLANILPVAWCSNTDIYVDKLDRDFFNCLPLVREAFQRLYPELNFSGEVIAREIVDNWIDEPQSSPIILYSGGVDATFTVLGNLALCPHIVSVRGSDIYFSEHEDKAWKLISHNHMKFSNQFGLVSCQLLNVG